MQNRTLKVAGPNPLRALHAVGCRHIHIGAVAPRWNAIDTTVRGNLPGGLQNIPRFERKSPRFEYETPRFEYAFIMFTHILSVSGGLPAVAARLCRCAPPVMVRDDVVPAIRERSINRRHVYTKTGSIYTYPQCSAEMSAAAGPALFIIFNANFLVFNAQFPLFVIQGFSCWMQNSSVLLTARIHAVDSDHQIACSPNQTVAKRSQNAKQSNSQNQWESLTTARGREVCIFNTQFIIFNATSII